MAIKTKKLKPGNTKLVVSLLAFGFLVMSALTAVIVIFAYSSQSYVASILISYKAEGINGEIELLYKTEEMSGFDMIASSPINASNNQATLSPSGDIVLTANNSYVEFKYVFRNFDDDPYSAIWQLDESTEMENMLLNYSYKTADNYTPQQYAVVVNGTKESSLVNAQGKRYEEQTFYLKISIENLAYNASFFGGFNWELEAYSGEAPTDFEAAKFVHVGNGEYAVAYGGGDISASGLGELSSQSVDNIWYVPTQLGSNDVTALVDGDPYPQNTKVVVSEGITSIQGGLSDENIIEITICKTVTNLEEGVITAPNLKVLNYDANVPDVNIVAYQPPPYAGVYQIEKYVFSEAGKDSDSLVLNIGENCKNIADCLFYASKITEVNFSKNVETVGYGAFSLSGRIKSVHVNDLNAFAQIDFKDRYSNPLLTAGDLYCNGVLVTNLTLSGISKVGTAAFMGCRNLQSVILPEGVTSIGTSAFLYCDKLVSINIPSSVTEIGAHAFFNCDSLANVTFADVNGWSATSIGDEPTTISIASSTLSTSPADALKSMYRDHILTKSK